jgi:hypothetical protein
VSQHEAALRKMGWRMKTHRGEGLWEDPRQPEVFHSMCSALAQAMVYAVQRLDELEARGAKGGSALEPTVVWRGSVSEEISHSGERQPARSPCDRFSYAIRERD